MCLALPLGGQPRPEYFAVRLAAQSQSDTDPPPFLPPARSPQVTCSITSELKDSFGAEDGTAASLVLSSTLLGQVSELPSGTTLLVPSRQGAGFCTLSSMGGQAYLEDLTSMSWPWQWQGENLRMCIHGVRSSFRQTQPANPSPRPAPHSLAGVLPWPGFQHHHQCHEKCHPGPPPKEAGAKALFAGWAKGQSQGALLVWAMVCESAHPLHRELPLPHMALLASVDQLFQPFKFPLAHRACPRPAPRHPISQPVLSTPPIPPRPSPFPLSRSTQWCCTTWWPRPT